tara:strand:- start:530 stop:721 length:192 start_codon:yes stop_codon:yes gene_type:complete
LLEYFSLKLNFKNLYKFLKIMISFPIALYIFILAGPFVYFTYRIFQYLIEKYRQEEDAALLGP